VGPYIVNLIYFIGIGHAEPYFAALRLMRMDLAHCRGRDHHPVRAGNGGAVPDHSRRPDLEAVLHDPNPEPA
jgi:hypothetical protein